MLHLRLGRLRGAHGFLESGGTASPGGPPDFVRMGLGYGWGQRRQAGVRATLGVAAFPSQGEPSFALMLRLPVAKSLDLGVAGAYRLPNGGNIGVFGRANWGQLPREE